jgi:peroxiredoxin
MAKLFLKIVRQSFLSLVFLGQMVSAQELEKLNSFSIYQGNEEVVNLDSFFNQKLIVLIFTSSNCSYALKYHQRLTHLYQTFHPQKVTFIAVNSNDPSISGQDSLSRMHKISPYPFPYVKDEDQSIARKLKASINPEAIVLIPKEGRFQIGYRGKIDDNPLSERLVKHHYLRDALTRLLKGQKPSVVKNTPLGCDITWIE